MSGSEADWDCGTRNGQVANILAKQFKTVYATDISEEQPAMVTKKQNIHYLKERSEQTTLATISIDLITAAQAIHWLDFDKYFNEVNRVGKNGTLVAA